MYFVQVLLITIPYLVCLSHTYPIISFLSIFFVGWMIKSRLRGHISCFIWISRQQGKKAYMLFNLTPDPSVTGGTWYSDQEFESEFVEVLNQQCFKFLQQKVGSLLYSHLCIYLAYFCSTNFLWQLCYIDFHESYKFLIFCSTFLNEHKCFYMTENSHCMHYMIYLKKKIKNCLFLHTQILLAKRLMTSL